MFFSLIGLARPSLIPTLPRSLPLWSHLRPQKWFLPRPFFFLSGKEIYHNETEYNTASFLKGKRGVD